MINKPDGTILTSDGQSEQNIPPANTWDGLSTNQLIDLKLTLENRAWTFRNQPALKKVLDQSIQRLTNLIASRS